MLGKGRKYENWLQVEEKVLRNGFEQEAQALAKDLGVRKKDIVIFEHTSAIVNGNIGPEMVKSEAHKRGHAPFAFCYYGRVEETRVASVRTFYRLCEKNKDGSNMQRSFAL